MRSDIVPGGTFPDYELPDHTDTPRRLSELQGDDPLILTLARGHYCPKEHQQHLELAAFYPKIAVAYTQIATIATDEHHTLQEFRASVGAQWPFLSDPGRIVQQDLDIQEYTDPDHDPMIPHTLVLKPGLVVHSIYNGYWFWGRPSVVDLWRDLRDVLAARSARTGTSARPGSARPWDAGDCSPFHGWDRRAAQEAAHSPTAKLKGRRTDAHHPLPPDHHLHAGAVHRRADRLRAGPLGALPQQRRRLPQGPRPGPPRPTSPRAPAASGSACTTTGPIRTASSSRPPTPTPGEAPPATPTPSRRCPTGRPTSTSSWCARARTSRDGSSGSCSGPSARALSARLREQRQGHRGPQRRRSRDEPLSGAARLHSRSPRATGSNAEED